MQNKNVQYYLYKYAIDENPFTYKNMIMHYIRKIRSQLGDTSNIKRLCTRANRLTSTIRLDICLYDF